MRWEEVEATAGGWCCLNLERRSFGNRRLSLLYPCVRDPLLATWIARALSNSPDTRAPTDLFTLRARAPEMPRHPNGSALYPANPFRVKNTT